MRIWRSAHAAALLSIATVFGGAATISSADETRLVRTGQMWGSELAEGKITANIGIAGECVQHPDRNLTCQFASVGVSDDGQCLVSTWSERLRLVRKTSEIVTWAGTRGPTGLGGAMTASTLIAERSTLHNSKTDFFNTRGPGPFDGWSYKSTQSFSAPSPLSGKALPAVNTEVKSSSSRPALRCSTTAIMAISPMAED